MEVKYKDCGREMEEEEKAKRDIPSFVGGSTALYVGHGVALLKQPVLSSDTSLRLLRRGGVTTRTKPNLTTLAR